MAFVPESYVKLLHTPLDVNGQNQIRFSTVSAQSAYFNSVVLFSFTGFTYQRKDNVIRIPAHIDTLWACNYVMYENSNFTSKWFYAYITNMAYINDNCTEISIKTDVYQTWMLSCTLKDSFIVRAMERGESMSGYQPGTNLCEENLETGEYVMNAGFVTTELNPLSILALASDTYETTMSYNFMEMNGVPCGLYAFLFADVADLESWIENMTASPTTAGSKADAIVAIFLVPTAMLSGGGTPGAGHSFFGDHVSLLKSVGSKPLNLNGYVPKNKKLLTYPYTFMYASNRQSQAAIYRYEYFDNTAIYMQLDGGPMPSVEIKLTPKNYKGMTLNYDESLSLSGYPCLGWVSDVFKTWLAQNAYNIPINIGTAALSTITAGIAGSAVGVVGGALAVGAQLAAVKTHEMMPDQAHGSTTGSANIGMGTQNFLIMQKSITAQFAKKIDEYFTMYGYKQNKVETPVFSRAHWDYIKTIDCNLTGNIPAPDMEELKSLFNNGITLWKTASEIGDYSLNNYEVV